MFFSAKPLKPFGRANRIASIALFMQTHKHKHKLCQLQRPSSPKQASKQLKRPGLRNCGGWGRDEPHSLRAQNPLNHRFTCLSLTLTAARTFQQRSWGKRDKELEN
ncbi:hypothetical protein V8C43DRAFT_279622 [Trichoderma afarasin]